MPAFQSGGAVSSLSMLYSIKLLISSIEVDVDACFEQMRNKTSTAFCMSHCDFRLPVPVHCSGLGQNAVRMLLSLISIM